ATTGRVRGVTPPDPRPRGAGAAAGRLAPASRSPLAPRGRGGCAPLPLGQVRGAAPPTLRRYARWTFCRMQHAVCAYTMLHVVCCMRIPPVPRWLSFP
ncbi:hypothetical protein RZS08_06310, partial [Arthrospira platensis SPKY1]|nr:hypothetical protein [Arthrospira platensis SPKY1]